MRQFDPWRGTNQGLATLGNTFDELERRRRMDMDNERRSRLDALQEPILRNQAEAGTLALDQQKRGAANLRAYDEQEAGFATATVHTEAGQPRPMSEGEKNDARIQLAMQKGDLATVSKIAKFVEITDKMDERATTSMTKTMQAIQQVRATMGPAVALEIGKKMLREMPGVDPSIVDKAVLSPQGILSVPDGQGGTVMTIPTPDGKYHVVHSKAKDETLDRERLAVSRERLALDRERIVKGGGGRGGATALMKNTEFLASLGYSRKEAADLLSSSKPMSRETFIGQATLRVMNNTFIPEGDKPGAIQQAIEIFDSSVKKGAAPTTDKVLDKATATSILKEAGGDKDKARKLAKDRGYKF